MTDPRATFQGSIPQYYDDCLGQAYFGPPAAELVRRVPSNPGGDVLEIACGTGQVTRRLRARLDRSVKLVASDLSPAMVAYARAKVGEEAIEWREADAQDLPFPDGTFGAVACALGFMFLPDKPKGMADPAMIRALASGAGFRDLKIESVQLEVSGVSARTIATGMVRGTPRSNLIAKKGFDFEQVIDVVAAALAKSGGADSYRAPSRVILVEARK